MFGCLHRGLARAGLSGAGSAGAHLPGKIGYIVRPSGFRQVTINGYPIYKYAGDKAPGQAKGNGIGRVWHVIKITTM